MVQVTNLAYAKFSNDCDCPINFDWVASPFKLGNLNPFFPDEGVDLRDFMPSEPLQGRSESWEQVFSRGESYARSEFGYGKKNPYRSITPQTRLLIGTLALPKPLLIGTFKRLFVEFADIPNTWQVHAVAHALFNPPMAFWGGESWANVCYRAEMYVKRRELITAQVRQLLARGE